MVTHRVLLLLLAASFTTCDLNLTILHNNDIHAHFDPVSARTSACRGEGPCYGGIGRLVHAVNAFKQNVPNTLVLYGGDIFQGHLYYTLFKWRVVVDMINLVPYDAMALGNHEFDDGLGGLLPYLENVVHPLLCTNINFGPYSSPITRRCLSSIVREMGGYKIGIMGYTTTDTPGVALVPPGVKFLDEVEALQEETKRLQAMGAQIIIATGHSGYVREKEMAEKIDGIDIIVGGHSHSLLYSGNVPDDDPVEGPYPTVVKQPSGRTVLVVQAYQYGKYLGVLNVTFDGAGEVRDWSGNPVVLDGEKDLEAEQRLAVYTKQVRAKEAAVIGETAVQLVGDRTVCRRRECNLGNFIADSMVRAVLTHNSEQWSKVPAAIYMGGGVRDSIDKGNITQAQVQTVQPFGNTVDVARFSGDVLRRVFEHSVSKYKEDAGRFLQVSGIRVTYDLSKPVGFRVNQLEIVCSHCLVPKLEPLQLDKQYYIALPTYLLSGGDSYDVIERNAMERSSLGLLDVDVLRRHVIRMSPVIAGLEGRIRFVNGTRHRESSSQRARSMGMSTLAVVLACSVAASKALSAV